MKYAIDVVLLPDEETMKLAEKIHKELRTQVPNGAIVLGAEGALPHISLAMGVLSEEDLSELVNRLRALRKGTVPMECAITELRSPVIPTGDKVADFALEKTEKITNFQQEVMNACWDLVSYDNIDASLFHNPESVHPQTFSWVAGYGAHYQNPDRFNPHITLGFGDADMISVDLPKTFLANRLAVFQLGTFCTCPKILAEIEEIG